MPDTISQTVTEIDFSQPAAATPMVPVSAPPAGIAPDANSMPSVIERMACDPAVDIDKLERLIAMHERMQARQAQTEFDNAMMAAQGEMGPIRADMENSQTRSKYASYAQLDHAIRPIYTKHGFAVTFNTGDAPKSDDLRVLATVSHQGGHRQEYRLDMPADGKGARGGDVMTRTHAAGAAASYGQRYLQKLIWNLAVGDVDDDGNSASGVNIDSDIERMGTGPRDADGRLMSNYSAKKAASAQEWANQAIEYLNLANNVAAAKDWLREKQTVPPGKRKSPLQWLQEASPGQYMRVQQCYQNVTGEDLE